MRLLTIPAASFEMGLSDSEEARLQEELGPAPFPFHFEKPLHRVEVPAFEIAETPTTNLEYLEFVQGGGYERPELWTDLLEEPEVDGKAMLRTFVDQNGRPGPLTWQDGRFAPGLAAHPVSGVSWYEASAFCAFKGLRLPREREWELAARGTDGRSWPWGASFDPDRVTHFERKPLGTVPVESLPEGRSPSGLLHAAGNVAEWCEELFDLYPGSRAEAGLFGPLDRVVRNDFYSGSALTLRVTVRTPRSPEDRFPGLGFRCAR